jgi:cereblon
LHASCSEQLDDVDSEPEWDCLSPTSTSSDHSVPGKRIYLSDSQSSGSLSGILDESSSDNEDPMRELPSQNHGSVKTIDTFGHSVKHTNSGDEVDLCVTSSKSISRARKNTTTQRRHYCGAYKSKMSSQAPLSFWPRWAYELYDSYSLSWRAAGIELFIILAMPYIH